MITFFNKYKRLFVCFLFTFVFIMMFLPTITNSVMGLFARVNKAFSIYRSAIELDYDTTIYKESLQNNILGLIFIILGVILSATTVIFINKRIPYCAGFLILALASIFKIGCQCGFAIGLMGQYDAWTDYIIISIALLMLIVDIVRLSLYIRTHKDEIRAKAADITASLKTKLQREHKPTKDERIAELEERVKQLEDKQDE